ncbi:hypothetical protein MMC15_005321 [Xylographa vitiligo]|nr:hypothetical protein [Xylographa vitiligo]
MNRNNRNPFNNIDVDIRRAANGNTNDNGPPPWPLAPWADSSYLPYTPPSHPPDPNPHSHVRARVVGFLDRDAARQAPSNLGRRARSPSTLQRLRIRATRRSERAVARRATSNGDGPAGNRPTPVEGTTAEAPVPQPFEFQNTPAQITPAGLQLNAERAMQVGAASVGEELRPGYLDGMVGWAHSTSRKRSLDSRECVDPTALAAAAFGSVVTPRRPCPPLLAAATWPYGARRMMQGSMLDVNVILNQRVRRNREQWRRKAALRREMVRRLEDAHRSP